MEHGKAFEDLHGQYEDIVKEFHRVLEERGMKHLKITGVEFEVRSLALQTDGCPPGTYPKQVCVRKAGGGIHCFTTCVPK